MRLTRLTACALAALAAGCASTPQRKREVVWPDLPEKPRIRFVQSFQSEQDFESGGWASFSRSLFGTTPRVRITHPMGLGLSPDGKKLYIADLRGSQVLVADFEKRSLKAFADDIPWQHPAGVAVDAKGTVYVSDARARRIYAIDPEGRMLRAFGPEIERPTGLAYDDEKKILYVADTGRQDNQSHRVFAFTPEGKILREIGSGRGDGDGQFNFPSYLALDSKGNLYVNDSMNFRIQVFDPEGAFVRVVGQQGAGPGSFSRSKGLAFDAFDNLYVADGEHAVVQIFNPRFEPLLYFGGNVAKVEFMDIPSAVAIDRKTNRIYVANELTPRVNVYDLVNTSAEDSFIEPPPVARPAK